MTFEKELEAFQLFVKDGSYADKTESTKNISKAKELLRDQLHSSEQKRHEYKHLGWVAKFQPVEVKTTDHPGLIEEILNYVRSEALSQVVTLDTALLQEDGIMEVADEFLYKPTYHLKSSLNKFGKSFNYTLGEDYTGLCVEDLVRHVAYNHNMKNRLDGIYKLLLTPFTTMKEQKLVLDVGNIYKVPNKPVWDINALIKAAGLGEEFIRRYGKVQLTKLDEWIQIGAIPKNIKSEYQQVIDVRLDFTVMSLQAEKIAYDAFQRRLERRVV